VRSMRRMPIALFLFMAALAAYAQVANLPSPGSSALVEDSNDWNGRKVRFTGEAIGESMRRGTMSWIHLNDDPYGLEETAKLSGFNSGIGVWIEAGLASRIAVFGGYGNHGDVVEITGIFNAACPEHGGDMDIHADSLRIVRAGNDTAHPIALSRMLAAAVMGALTIGLFLAYAMLRRRSAVEDGRKT
jgi:hypothetical protein